MKKIIILGLLLLSSVAFGETISCVTGAFPTTSMTLEDHSNGGYVLSVLHHNGVKFAPIHEGIVTTHDIDFLKRKSKIVLGLGESYQLHFLKDECSRPGERILCHSNRKVKVKDVELLSFGVSFYRERLSSPYGEFLSWKARSHVRTNGDPIVHQFLMEYQETDCIQR